MIPICSGNRVVKKDLLPTTEQVSRSPGDHPPFHSPSHVLRGPNHTAHMLHYKSDNGRYVVLMGRNQMLLISENLTHYHKHGLASTQVWYTPVCSKPPMIQGSGATALFIPEASHEPCE